MKAKEYKVQSKESPKICVLYHQLNHIQGVRLEGIFQFSFPC